MTGYSHAMGRRADNSQDLIELLLWILVFCMPPSVSLFLIMLCIPECYLPLGILLLLATFLN